MVLDPKAYWIGFNRIRGVGAVRFKQLLEYFRSLEVAWNAPYESLRNAGLGEKSASSIVKSRDSINLDSEWEKIVQNNIQVIIWGEEAYPRRLKEIEQAPPVIYIKGTFQEQDDWAVAIVGTRQKTSYGRQVAEELACFLAQNNISVVSGLARGIDSIAHEAALKAGGRTIAVLGCGVDQVYPPEHRRMAESIIQQGALISDFALGTPPDGINFPPRNRIISGLSLATVVVEAGETSGALITATFAVNQGREVFAVPGNITSPKSKGTNRLIQDGARPLLNFNEILESLNLEHVSDYHYAQTVLPADAIEAALIKLLNTEPLHIDDIQEATGLPVEKVSAALVMMELKGMVNQTSPMTYMAAKDDFAEYKVN